MLTNKKLGSTFESDLCVMLADNGFWVHNFANRKNGQPADIIAVKDNVSYLIDAKVCSYEAFSFRRIEENQHYAMQKWIDCNNSSPFFALFTRGNIYMVTYVIIKELIAEGKKQLNFKDIVKYGIPLANWLRMVEWEN